MFINLLFKDFTTIGQLVKEMDGIINKQYPTILSSPV